MQNHRRRIITPQLLAEYAFLLAPGGRLYTATDVPEARAAGPLVLLCFSFPSSLGSLPHDMRGCCISAQLGRQAAAAHAFLRA